MCVCVCVCVWLSQPTWFDFHPDVPVRPAADLYWSTQVAAFHDVIEEMHLTDITCAIARRNPLRMSGIFFTECAKMVCIGS